MKPIIGIICGIKEIKLDGFSYDLSLYNVDAIKKSNGIPLILPYDINSIDNYLHLVDGLYFTGGQDVNPMYYNEDPHKNIGSIIPDRDLFEIELCKKAFEKKIPILGVCRGAQIINVACGGNLYQDLDSQLNNHICHIQESPTPLSSYFHLVDLSQNTIIESIFNTNKIHTNSYHHQSVKDIATDFIVSARTSDGVVEAIECTKDQFILGIQWHPERMIDKHKEALLIYERFIQECKK